MLAKYFQINAGELLLRDVQKNLDVITYCDMFIIYEAAHKQAAFFHK